MRKLTLAEERRHRLGNDSPRRGIGQRAFEAVAHFDPNLFVILGEDEQGAVVLAFAADFPRVGHPD